MKVVINECFGGFSVSLKALEYMGIDPKSDEALDFGYVSWDYDSDLEENEQEDIEEIAQNDSSFDEDYEDFWKKIDDEKIRIRTDPRLIKCVEEIGEESFGNFAELKIVEIPDDVEWGIDDYDGIETIHEKHRVWF
ncbi:MAG: hypothetical protein UT24_C0019G0021 [Candidatus Woesebacteria bacterium GW2011_GWB1_39_12]|uniref:Uncharacterized protein n=1 Tax=Candidatus Woesebacteria bacterium GW2011_GWB1_39_12 TaxID=1618574 RepID=A0A0G0QE33_9BACT|nr:MAG: hypothetical protein UT24_C0019G0021 [Candidatus Woesebacteria bacterium GW2011_GWB1_39_12]